MLPINPVPLSPSTMLLLPPDATIKNHRVLTVARDGSLSDRLHLGLSGLTVARDVPDSGRSHLALWPFGSATHSRDAHIGHLRRRETALFLAAQGETAVFFTLALDVPDSRRSHLTFWFVTENGEPPRADRAKL